MKHTKLFILFTLLFFNLLIAPQVSATTVEPETTLPTETQPAATQPLETQPMVTAITLTAEKNEIEIGATLPLKATITPENASNAASVTYISSDINVATVDTTGLVTARKAGSTTITCKTTTGTEAIASYTIIVVPNAPTGLSFDTVKTKSLRLKWKASSDADGYIIEKYSTSSKKWSTAATVTKDETKITLKKLTTGGMYKFRMKAFITIADNRYYSQASNTLNACTKPGTTKITSAKKSLYSSTMKVKWKKVKNCTGYQLGYTVSRYGYFMTTKKAYGGTSITLKNLGKGTRYYIKIRAFNKVGKKTYYGSWSKLRSVSS